MNMGNKIICEVLNISYFVKWMFPLTKCLGHMLCLLGMLYMTSEGNSNLLYLDIALKGASIKNCATFQVLCAHVSIYISTEYNGRIL